MKNVTFRRILAYLIDLFIVSVIASLIAYIPFLNPGRDDYDKSYNAVLELFSKYQNEEISLDEYENEFTAMSYDLNKSNISYTVINLVVIIAYFGVFQWQRKGKTLGKQIMKLKIVSMKEKEEVSFVSYLIRAIILNNVIISVLQIIVLFCFSKENYYALYNNLNLVGYILIYVMAFLVFIRQDHRGLHDLITGTKVTSQEETEDTNKEIPEATIKEVKDEKKKSTKTKK